MKIGDLVRCKYIDGQPIGIIVTGPRHGVNNTFYDVLVQGKVWPFHHRSIEAVK